jgi:hypothetical protein
MTLNWTRKKNKNLKIMKVNKVNITKTRSREETSRKKVNMGKEGSMKTMKAQLNIPLDQANTSS